MRISLWAIISVLVVISSVTGAEAGASDIVPRTIEKNQFVGFEECRISDELSATLASLIADGTPLKKEDMAWTYSVSATVMGLSIKAVRIGVCDAEGLRACGWGAYIALIVEKPFDESRRHLKKNTGIDFTQERRDEEFEVTLRPILARSPIEEESVLYCDPGTL